MSLVRYRANPYRRMYNRTSSNARARAQFSSAKKTNDRLEFVVNCNHVFTASYNPTDESGVAAVNVWDVLERNGYFNNLSNMYDQIKIDGVTVKLSVTNAYTDINNIASIKNITTYVGWDRTGLSTNQVKLYDSSNNEIPEMNDDETEVKTWRTNIGSAIVKATGVVKNEINSFQRWRYNTYIYPSLLQEKQQYVTTSDIKRFNKSFDVNTTKFTVADRYNNQTPNGIYDSNNPVVPFESSSVKFKPTLLVGVFQNGLSENQNGQYGEITQYGFCRPVIFNAEFSISCSFKNLKGVSDQYRISEGGNRLLLSFIPETSIASNYETINIPNLKNSIYVKENEHDENYATNLTVRVPSGSSSTDKIQLTAIRPINETTLAPDTTQGHTIPFSDFQLIEQGGDIIIPASIETTPGGSREASGGVIIHESNNGLRIWPVFNKYYKPIKAIATKTLKYAPLGYSILNKLIGVCRVASGDIGGLRNIVNMPFLEPVVTEADIESADLYINVEESKIADYDSATFLPFTTFSIAN